MSFPNTVSDGTRALQFLCSELAFPKYLSGVAAYMAFDSRLYVGIDDVRVHERCGETSEL